MDPGTIVNAIVRGDGIYYIGGSYISVGGVATSNLGRFTNDGIFLGWGGFPAPAIDGDVRSLALQSDGKILFGGQFASVNGQPYANLARLNANNTLDTTFDAGARSSYSLSTGVSKLHLQPNGRVIAIGGFSHFGGEPRQGFGRLVNDPATHTLTARRNTSPSSSPWVFNWAFRDSTPMVTSAGLEYSTDNGLTWVRPLSGVFDGYRVGSGFLGSPGSTLFTGQNIVSPRLWRAHGYVNGTDALITDQIMYPAPVISEWRLAYFESVDATGSGADLADPDGDGVSNLLAACRG
jgi:hypothetical protein